MSKYMGCQAWGSIFYMDHHTESLSYNHYPYFIDEETEVQQCRVTLPKSHHWAAELGFKPRALCFPNPYFLTTTLYIF